MPNTPDFPFFPWYLLEDIIVPIAIVFIVIGLPILCFTILAVMRHRHGGMKAKDRDHWNEETQMMQELHDQLTKMETRIETLETILMENYGKDKR